MRKNELKPPALDEAASIDPGDAAPSYDESLLPPQHSIGYLVRDSHRMFRMLLNTRIAEHGVTAAMWSYLWELWQRDGLSQRDLAHRVGLESPTVGTAIRVMEQRGLVIRERNPADRREWRIYLTSRAKRLRPLLLAEAARLNEEALQSMSPEQVLDLYKSLLQVRQCLRGLAGRSKPS